MGEQYAARKGLNIQRFPADWAHFGRAAAVKRNAEMAQVADAAIVLWDGKSAGAGNMIQCAKSAQIPCKIVKFED